MEPDTFYWAPKSKYPTQALRLEPCRLVDYLVSAMRRLLLYDQGIQHFGNKLLLGSGHKTDLFNLTLQDRMGVSISWQARRQGSRFSLELLVKMGCWYLLKVAKYRKHRLPEIYKHWNF